jgi:hypothetical protein
MWLCTGKAERKNNCTYNLFRSFRSILFIAKKIANHPPDSVEVAPVVTNPQILSKYRFRSQSVTDIS